VIERDADGRIRFDTGHAPRRDTSSTTDPLLVTLADPITDPSGRDTDGDTLEDGPVSPTTTTRVTSGSSSTASGPTARGSWPSTATPTRCSTSTA
jgi:hypothetical protein